MCMYHYLRQEAEVVEGPAHPPLSECMQQYVVFLSTLVAVELVEQPVTIVQRVWILQSIAEKSNYGKSLR